MGCEGLVDLEMYLVDDSFLLCIKHIVRMSNIVVVVSECDGMEFFPLSFLLLSF